MAVQLSVAARNARLDAIETELGSDPVLKIFSGAQPANCAAANSGTELWTEALPTDAFAAASSGSKAKNGTWQANAIAAGTAGHWRLYKSDGTTCVAQGSVTATGGGGDMTVDNTNIANGQQVTVSTFTLTDANA
jgi:hypothetical protein